jgi:hypothetical protein
MGDLGDLGAFMKEGGLADLDWLDVNEEDYRKLETLPKQNLDVRPDLEALWAREDRPATNYLIPNKVPVPPFPGAGTPHTMGDMSQAHGHIHAQAEDIRKVARLVLMQTSDPRRLRDALTKRFGLQPLRENRQVLAEVLQERGLLGRLYIAASDFPGCHTGSKAPSQFARRFANEAKFVVAKPACQGCSHASKGPTGSTNCAVFHKEIQLQVPYSEGLATAVEESQKAKGKEVQGSSGTPKERIRLAMLAPDSSLSPAVWVYAGQGIAKTAAVAPLAQTVATERLIQASDLLRKNRNEQQVAFQAQPIVALLRREMAKGLAPSDLVKSLRLSFSQDSLRNTRSHWEPLFKEAGLFGVIYSTQDSFSECREGADFLAKHNPQVRAIVAGEKCGSCFFNKGRCLMYGKPLVKAANDLYTPETVEAVLTEHRTAGRLPAWQSNAKAASTWGSNPREALKAIHKAATQPDLSSVTPSMRMDIVKAFHGGGSSHITSGMTRRDIVKQASKLLNEGLYGKQLLAMLKARFEPRDLVAAKGDLRRVLAEQGLQGIYFVDPTVYDDYGKSCDEPARLHRSRLVSYVKIGEKCGSCVFQSKIGFCSKINKPLVHEPPYVDKVQQQQAILATGESTENSFASLVNNGLSMMAEYQMQNGGMEVEVRDAAVSQPLEVDFNNQKFNL